MGSSNEEKDGQGRAGEAGEHHRLAATNRNGRGREVGGHGTLPPGGSGAISPGVRVSSADIQALAERIVEALLKQGFVKGKAEKPILSKRVAALILENLEQEAAIEAEAERMAERHSRDMSGMDQRRVIDMIKKKIAEEKGFTL